MQDFAPKPFTRTLCTLPKLPAQLNFTSQLASLRFLQANLDHTRAATEHFVSYMEATNIDFAVVSDPYVRGGTVPGIPPRWFKFHHAQTPRCMVVSRNVSLDLFPIHVSPFVIALTLNAPNLSILFIGVYAAPSVALDHILPLVPSWTATTLTMWSLLVILMLETPFGGVMY